MHHTQGGAGRSSTGTARAFLDRNKEGNYFNSKGKQPIKKKLQGQRFFLDKTLPCTKINFLILQVG
jgi:hypothetical protein